MRVWVDAEEVDADRQLVDVGDRMVRFAGGIVQANVNANLAADFEIKVTGTAPAAGDSRTLRVLLASRLLWDKGIREYIEAAKLVKEAGLPVEFLLAGNPDPGNPASVPEAQIARWQAAASCCGDSGKIASIPSPMNFKT